VPLAFRRRFFRRAPFGKDLLRRRHGRFFAELRGYNLQLTRFYYNRKRIRKGSRFKTANGGTCASITVDLAL
jgi:hypothetical protein